MRRTTKIYAFLFALIMVFSAAPALSVSAVSTNHLLLGLITKKPVDISGCKITVSKTVSYTGKAVKPKVTVKNGKTTLKNGTHYTVKYSSNKKIGTGKVTVTGIEKNGYKNSKTFTFKIVPKKPKVTAKKKTTSSFTLSWKKVTRADKYYIYKRNSKGKYTKIGETKKLSYSDKNVTPDNYFYYKVRGVYTLNGKTILGFLSSPAKIYTSKIDPNKKMVALTFDDGPNDGTTNIILDILKEEGVKATFFVTNKGPDELIKREHDEGHTVALHTATHDYAYLYSSVDAYFEDLTRVQTRVKNITGEEAKIIRFPGGSSNTISRKYSPGIMTTLTSEVQNRGFKYYDWNLSSGDAAGGTPTSDMIYNNVVSNLRHDRVNMVLMHDIKPYTRDALKRIIQFGKENGYRFEQITMATEMITQRVNN